MDLVLKLRGEYVRAWVSMEGRIREEWLCSCGARRKGSGQTDRDVLLFLWESMSW